MMSLGMEKVSTDTIWAAFSDRLRAFIGKRVKEENDVQDVLQEVFAKIHAGLGSLKEDEKLEAWLFQVARRAVSDHFRSRSGNRRTDGLPEDISEGQAGETVTAEVASWLEPMMSLLPEEDRDVLRKADLEGTSQKELAGRLGLSVTAAKSRVQRARKRLKEALLNCCHIEMDGRGNAIGYTRKDGPCSSCACD
jgi:RNA polymerase sigma-70 factor (ECF subfamily)